MSILTQDKWLDGQNNSDYGTMAEQFTFTKIIIVFAKRESGKLSKTMARLYAFLGDPNDYTLSLML